MIILYIQHFRQIWTGYRLWLHRLFQQPRYTCSKKNRWVQWCLIRSRDRGNKVFLWILCAFELVRFSFNLYIIISILDKYSFYSLFWLRDLLVYQQLPRRCMSTISRQKLMITRILQIPWEQDIQLWVKITRVLTTIKLKHVLR